ncbi:MAG: TIGR03087 family PEP-CTERM/XrtA system glycosyltransferase [Burkholderiaceae bacterium]|nr:TIGR03087 family PEP-CTERM/XrtA system glycosyltransferase [Burkholderiaceae bacterium]
MAKLLYLVHRLPYPPDKGDKVRSYHLLKHLLAQHEVHLGSFIDDPEDERHVPALQALCASTCLRPLQPRSAKLKSLSGLATGEALTLRYYDDARLDAWVAETLAREAIDAIVVFSSSMMPYAQRHAAGRPVLLDLVDVDSAKWTQYAHNHAWPLSWLYRREGARLLAYERQAVAAATASFLVTAQEVALFERLAPECRGRVTAVANGVDAEFFAPDASRPSPFAPDELPIVFTGAMDYWPNIDAVTWFVQDMLPALRQRHPALRFHIVGRAPTPAVRALAGPAVSVTGTVPDVRPYLQHAAAVVAPLRLARGVQNKVLEAMAMGKAVVCARSCVQAIGDPAQVPLCPAETAADHLEQLLRLLEQAPSAQALGLAARRHVLAHYSWPARLAGVDVALQHACRTNLSVEPA